MSGTRSDEAKPKLSSDELATLLSTLQAEVVGLKTQFSEAMTRNEALEETIVNLTHENELLKRRIYGVISTDATSALIQPEKSQNGSPVPSLIPGRLHAVGVRVTV